MANPFTALANTINEALNKGLQPPPAPPGPALPPTPAPTPLPSDPNVPNTLSLVPTSPQEATVVQGQWIDATGQTPVAIPQIIVRMEEHRRVAEQFVEDREDFADKVVEPLPVW